MTITRLKTLLGAVTIATGFLGGAAFASADSLEAIMQVGKDRTVDARTSQGKIDRLADETRDLLADYKTVMKQVEGLKVYNARLDRQIANQERRIADIRLVQNASKQKPKLGHSRLSACNNREVQ